MTTTTQPEIATSEQLDALVAYGKEAFQADPPEALADSAAAAATHRVAWGGGLVAHPTGGVGLSAGIRSLNDGSNIKCHGRLTGTGLALCGGGGFGEFYLDLEELKTLKIYVSVAVVPGGPGWLPTLWATFWLNNQKIGWFGGAVAGITFPGWGGGFIEFF